MLLCSTCRFTFCSNFLFSPSLYTSLCLSLSLSLSVSIFLPHRTVRGEYHHWMDVQHLLPLPGFLLLYNNIWEHMVIASHTEPVNLLVCNIPIAWIYLLANCLTQYLCISSVFVLTTECSSLTVTLVVTLRKFVSLLFSIVYFNNPFTIHHWIGTTLVFVGTLIFTEMIPTFNLNKSAKSKQN